MNVEGKWSERVGIRQSQRVIGDEYYQNTSYTYMKDVEKFIIRHN